MKKIARQLSLVLDLPLPSLETELLSECIRTRMHKAGLEEDYEAYEQLLQLEEREISLLLCEILKSKTFQTQKLKQDKHDYEQELFTLKASIEDIIFEVSTDYRFLNAWTRDNTLLFYKKESFIGRTLREVLGDSFASTIETIIDRVIATQDNQTYEYLSPVDKNWYIAKTHYLAPKKGVHERVSITVKNIHSRKLAEKALIQSEKRYKALVDHSPHAIAVHAEGKVVFANHTTVRLLGYQSLEELLEVDIMKIVHPEDYDEVKRGVENIYTQRQDAPPRRSRFIKRDNSIIHVEVLGCMIDYEGKAAAQIVFRDISAEIQAQSQLKSQDKLLKGVNEAATYLLNEENEKVAISKALRSVLIATEADRAYIFENHKNFKGELCVSQRFEVVSEHTTPEIDNPELQNRPYHDAGFETWLTIFEKGEIVQGQIHEFSQDIQAFLKAQEILSLILIPIFIKHKFWGFLGLDDCTNSRSWSVQEADLLKNTANSIGNFIVKKQIEDCESIEHEVSRILSETEDINCAVRQILEKIGTNLNWDIGELWLPNDPPTYLSLEYGWHNQEREIFDDFLKYTQTFQYQLDEGLVGKAYQSAQPVWTTGIAPNSSSRRTAIALKVGIQSRVAIPIVLDNKVLGVLCLISTQVRDINDIYIRTFTSIGVQIGQYIKRKRVEKHFENIVNTIPAVIWRYDVETAAFTYVSHQAESMLGYPVEKWIGNSNFWISLIHEDDREYAISYCAESTAQKTDHEFEYRMINKKGEIVWISDIVHVVVKNDKAVELVGLLIDITEQKKAEQALALSEKRLKLAIDGAELGLWDWNIPEDTIYVNEALAHMLEYSIEEMPRKACMMFNWVHPEDREHVKLAVKSHLIGETDFYQDEFRLRTKSGNYNWLLDIGKLIERDKEGNPIRMLGIYRDIHSRKSADEQLRISEERLRLALKGVGIFDWNIQTDTFYLNESWEIYLGYQAGEINSTTSYFALIHPEDVAIVAKEFQMHMEGKIPFVKTEMRMKHKDGHYIWVLDQGEVVEWDERGKPIRLVSTHLDISEIKNYQQKIQELNKDLEARVEARTAELKASNQDLENFAYSISHDLRAPLRHINGYSRLLSQRSDDILDESTKEFVGFIADAALKLSQQIEDLLQYSRIGRKEIKVEEIDLEALINAQIVALEKENPTRQIAFNVSSLPHIFGDVLLIEQLFYNLLSNAVKYTGREPLAAIEVGVEESHHNYSFFVRDNGVGFDPTYAEKLFKVFKRLHGESEFEGTGIGLANVYRIVQRHHGKVWGESTLGEGATFYVRLPKMVLASSQK